MPFYQVFDKNNDFRFPHCLLINNEQDSKSSRLTTRTTLGILLLVAYSKYISSLLWSDGKNNNILLSFFFQKNEEREDYRIIALCLAEISDRCFCFFENSCCCWLLDFGQTTHPFICWIPNGTSQPVPIMFSLGQSVFECNKSRILHVHVIDAIDYWRHSIRWTYSGPKMSL